jgi:rubredoxin-NAD+ reductase
LAAAAGLAVNRGIVVDDHLRSSAVDVFAIGDCAEVEGQVRPYVMPIMHAAKALAATLADAPTAAVFPIMPVLIKTPACPVAVHAPPRGTSGSWTTESFGDGLLLRFSDPDGGLCGFALVGARAVAERAGLSKQAQRITDQRQSCQ